MRKLTLTGIPQSTNHIYKSHCRFGYPTVYLSANGKTLKEDYGWQAKSQYKEKPSSEKLSLQMKVYRKKSIGDIDNFNKLVFDALTGIVWKDDKQIYELQIEKLTDTKNPRIELIINNYEK